jgi:hypothetical protein
MPVSVRLSSALILVLLCLVSRRLPSSLPPFESIPVTVSPSPQPKEDENEKLHQLRRYARDFWRQHTTDAEWFNWGSDDEDYGLAIGRLVVT